MRCVCKSHVACLLFMFTEGRLAMPLQDMDLQTRHFFYSLNEGVPIEAGAEEGEF